ncbi:MAG: pyridoxal-dependent decarboxylase [Flavobacteriales bacterium]
MNKFWNKKSQEEIKDLVFKALEENVDYTKQHALGVPASYLDDKVFNQDASFVKDAPWISTLIRNPNHIGCHTLGSSESFFSGTQEIERNLIEICAVDILKGQPDMQDGYVASGGTEANMQAIWVYRNYFMNEFDATREEICILCSSDSHYSMNKAGNILAVDLIHVPVSENQREVEEEEISKVIVEATNKGKKYFIVVCNMMTTMFGSVDNIESYTNALQANDCHFKLHVDGAYGGFYFPFSNESSSYTFKNEHISSFTLDAHKMAQAPYGTGVFLIRKGLIHHVNTKEASYVEGEDLTLIGSRSGANAIATWMILVKNGPFGWHEKVFILQKRTEWMCNQLSDLEIQFYRNPFSNIITIRGEYISQKVATLFSLVPDSHSNPKWYKIVVMEHVTIEKLEYLVQQIKASK